MCWHFAPHLSDPRTLQKCFCRAPGSGQNFPGEEKVGPGPEPLHKVEVCPSGSQVGPERPPQQGIHVLASLVAACC